MTFDPRAFEQIIAQIRRVQNPRLPMPKSFLHASGRGLLISVRRDHSSEANRIGKLIRAYLKEHPKIKGIRGLAEKIGLSYDAVQKYANGSSFPPREKLNRLLELIEPTGQISEASQTLFDRTSANNESNAMTSPSEPEKNSSAADNISSTDENDSKPDPKAIDPVPERSTSESSETSSRKSEAKTKRAVERFVERAHYEDEPLYDDQEIFVPIHGFVRFTDEEMEVINHPAFQRLGEIYQLGQAHLVYRGATHKRLEHSLGSVHVAEQMMAAVAENHARLRRHNSAIVGLPLGSDLSKLERVFIRLAALLHDIGHLPAGHTLEDELHLVAGHDEIARLNLVLDRDDWQGSDAPPLRNVINDAFATFLPDETVTPVDLLIQIIAKDAPSITTFPTGFRIGVCQDIVGNTICADLLDYLHRDWYHIGKPKYYEQRLLQYMEIRESAEKEPKFVISLGERPNVKTDAISTILDLLESRYQLAESVLFHRTKCSAAAVLERAVQELRESMPAKERQSWIETLPKRLLDYSDLGVIKTLMRVAEERKCTPATLCLTSLLNRRIYKAVYTTFHSERRASVAFKLQQLYSSAPDAPQKRLDALRLLEKDFHLPTGSVAMYCPTRGMNAKIAEVSIHMDGVMQTFKDWDASEASLGGGHLGAQIVRFTRLWRVHVCLHRDQWNAMSEPMKSLFYRAVKEVMLGIVDFPADRAAHDLALAASMTPTSPYFNKTVVPREKAARRENLARYQSGSPSIAAFFDEKAQ
jgi:HD superfamily phosphohydrolase